PAFCSRPAFCSDCQYQTCPAFCYPIPQLREVLRLVTRSLKCDPGMTCPPKTGPAEKVESAPARERIRCARAVSPRHRSSRSSGRPTWARRRSATSVASTVSPRTPSLPLHQKPRRVETSRPTGGYPGDLTGDRFLTPLLALSPRRGG